MKIDRCRGFKDLPPEEMARFRLIEDIFRGCCLKWGYREVRTPTLEYLYLFTSVGTLTPGMLRRVYSFLDWDGWSGERVVLKPDGTIPVARMYIDSMAAQGLARLFYVTNVFMFDDTGKKPRERWQCGAELIGVNSPMADAELVALALDVLQRLGLENIELKLSHAGLIKALLDGFELSHSEQESIFDQLLDGNREVLSRIKTDKPGLVQALTLLLDMKGKSSGFLKNIKTLIPKRMPEFETGIDNFIGVCQMMENMGCNYSIDLASGKGFEYYTGVIFHLYIGQEIIGGGGRYDALISLMGGKDTPAAGFALYLDRLMKLIKQDIMAEPPAKRILIRVAPEAMTTAFGIAGELRKAGYIVEFALGGEKLAGYGWLIEVRSQKPQFILTEQANHRRFEVQTTDEVLTLLKTS
jgi:histidyl-tRNA synthetase